MTIAAFYQGTGRRKTAVARVRLVPGDGELSADDVVEIRPVISGG